MQQSLVTPLLMAAALAAAMLVPGAATADPAQPASVRYRVLQPPTGGSAPSGWGLSASAQGRSVELQGHGSQWADDSDARLGAVAAGYGWRGGGSSIMVGYQQRGSAPSGVGPRSYGVPSRARSGVFGLSFTLRRY